MENITAFISQFLLIWQRSKISFYAFVSLVILIFLAYNGAAIFYVHVPFPGKTQPELVNSSTLLPLLQKNQNLVALKNITTLYPPKRRRSYNYKSAAKMLQYEDVEKQFGVRAMEFFKASSCKLRFFMTWISTAETFGERELLCVGSLFKTHPNGCLIIVSDSLDSARGAQILRPFSDKGFKVTAMCPDFSYLLKNTAAEAWYDQLKRGNVNPGEISLGQNLSNLLRIGLLYRFGGIYLDTDVIVLKSFGQLRNAIGAQANDPATGKWSRLNNAVMIFDRDHPLLLEFMQEFAVNFDGNKWGHNGPYLVSRVVKRLSGRDGLNLTVLPPLAFYPVDWNRIGSLFKGLRSSSHSKWMLAKLRQIRSQSFAVHLWNKQSRNLKVENGSVIQQILLSCGVINNS